MLGPWYVRAGGNHASIELGVHETQVSGPGDVGAGGEHGSVDAGIM